MEARVLHAQRIEDALAQERLQRLARDPGDQHPDSLDDPGYVELTKRAAEAASWAPDDPRIEELASLLTHRLPADRALLAMPPRSRSDTAARYGAVNHHREDRAPAIARLNALVETNLRAAGIDVPYR